MGYSDEQTLLIKCCGTCYVEGLFSKKRTSITSGTYSGEREVMRWHHIDPIIKHRHYHIAAPQTKAGWSIENFFVAGAKSNIQPSMQTTKVLVKL